MTMKRPFEVIVAEHGPTVLRVCRAERRRATPVAGAAETRSATDVSETPDDGLWAALRVLPTKQRQAVAYHHVGGMPYAEVAALVGGSTDAARRAAHDGIRALRRRYRNSQPITLQKDSRS
jgi:DNA-directed RNA polymerase specialized sigma24 family protein